MLKETPEDLIFMKKALILAKQAEQQGEVPVGAVLVQENNLMPPDFKNRTDLLEVQKYKVIASVFNQKEHLRKATAHAEILAIEEASRKLGRWRLNDCVLYVTLEPCLMCAGALVAARLKRLVYACKDPKAGAIHSLYQVTKDPRLNHCVHVHSGMLQEESAVLLKNFFRKKRTSSRLKQKSN